MGLVEGKRGKKLEETLSFDVKPSGQVAHQSIKLVRSMLAGSSDLTTSEIITSLVSFDTGEWSHLCLHLFRNGRYQ